MTRIVRRAIALVLLCGLVAVWAVTLRPQAIGGPAVFVAVRGSSMLPTYENGDLVVVESAAHYAIGEVVAFRVPAGEVGEGKVVLHRIVDGDAEHGFVLQGDHNTAPDPWFPRQADIVGIAAWRLVHVGSVINLVRQPVILAGLAAAIMVTFILARPLPPRPEAVRPRPTRALAPRKGGT
jgi:signal peptidase